MDHTDRKDEGQMVPFGHEDRPLLTHLPIRDGGLYFPLVVDAGRRGQLEAFWARHKGNKAVAECFDFWEWVGTGVKITSHYLWTKEGWAKVPYRDGHTLLADGIQIVLSEAEPTVFLELIDSLGVGPDGVETDLGGLLREAISAFKPPLVFELLRRGANPCAWSARVEGTPLDRAGLTCSLVHDATPERADTFLQIYRTLLPYAPKGECPMFTTYDFAARCNQFISSHYMLRGVMSVLWEGGLELDLTSWVCQFLNDPERQKGPYQCSQWVMDRLCLPLVDEFGILPVSRWYDRAMDGTDPSTDSNPDLINLHSEVL